MEMRPSEIAAVLGPIFDSGNASLILGPPGVGKSSLVFQAAAHRWGTKKDYLTTTVQGLPDVKWFVGLPATDKEPTDLRGLPYVENGFTRSSIPELLSYLTNPDGGVICIEELPQAIPAMQCVLRELLLDRRIAGRRIPDNYVVCATGNRVQDRAGAQRLLSHVASSVVVLELMPNLDDWQRWAVSAGIHGHVRNYLRFKPDSLHQFKPNEMLNADPRGWERVSTLLDRVHDDYLNAVIRGCVGDAEAIQFLTWRRTFANVVNPDDIIKKPKGAPVPELPDVLYAVVGALTDKAKNAPTPVLEAIVTYCLRLDQEFQALLMLDCMAVNSQLSMIDAVGDWCEENHDVLVANKQAV